MIHPPDERIEKLPRWAQRYITSLRYQINKQDEHLKEQEPTKTWWYEPNVFGIKSFIPDDEYTCMFFQFGLGGIQVYRDELKRGIRLTPFGHRQRLSIGSVDYSSLIVSLTGKEPSGG